MRIGVLTYWKSNDNYGQLLQCFALQYYLRNEGHDVFLVRYAPLKKELALKESFGKTLKRYCKCLNPYYLLIQRKQLRRISFEEETLRILNNESNSKRNFTEFRNNYINISDVIYKSVEQLRSNPPLADMFICGSDQVWHDHLDDENVSGWYLQFGKPNVKRISYAASIGRAITNDEQQLFKSYLSIFNAISVRERRTCEYCKSIGLKDVQVVCDPCFLLSRDFYSNFFKLKKLDEKSYIFVYSLNIRSGKEIFADELLKIAKDMCWMIQSVGSSGYCPPRNVIPNIQNIYATIPEWINLIFNSKLVVTSSFHGIVFSILLHKPFISIPLQGIYEKANDRIIDLLDFVGLSNRIAYHSNDIHSIMSGDINWTKVDERVSLYSKTGKDFLSSVIKI